MVNKMVNSHDGTEEKNKPVFKKNMLQHLRLRKRSRECEKDDSDDGDIIFEVPMKKARGLTVQSANKRTADNQASQEKNHRNHTDLSADSSAAVCVRKGPILGGTYIRRTTIWDYKTAICKDYKETGMCGFGDTCEFLHDRSDYKRGWEIEKTSGHADDQNFQISDEDDVPLNYIRYKSKSGVRRY